MFEVNLYTLNKKENSTKRPDGNGRPFQCILKDGSGLIQPSIQLDIGLTDDPSAYNYAYIPTFGRYYFIEEWYFDNALWTARMKADVLATYKDDIGNTDLYILRAANLYDGNIIDSLYPQKVSMTTYQVTNNLFDTNLQTGTWSLGIVSKEACIGSLAFYLIDYGNLKDVVSALLDDSNLVQFGFDPADASIALQKSLVDPLSYIKSCTYIPYPIDDMSQLPRPINIFGWDIGVSGKYIGRDVNLKLNTSFYLPAHPLSASRGRYMNVAPYSNISLLCDPFGEVTIDTRPIKEAEYLDVELNIDLTNGQGILTVTPRGSDFILTRRTAQVGVPVSLSQVTKDMVAQASAAGSFVGNLLTGDFGGALGGIADGVKAAAPKEKSTGSPGSFAGLFNQMTLKIEFYDVVADDPSHNGRPLCQIVKPRDLGGYMLIQDGDISTASTAAENREIRSYLEGGFYYE